MALLKEWEHHAEASAEFSKQVAKLSGDIGSLRNRDPEQVLRAITSALTGEREQLKGLGVVLKQDNDVDQRALTMTNKCCLRTHFDGESTSNFDFDPRSIC